MPALRGCLRLLPLLLVSLFSSHAASDDSVGQLPVEFSVGESGVASYSVSIDVPPGANGMQPRIALTYNSFSGRAQPVFSSISLCGRNKLDDGYVRAIQLDDADPFCMDGDRLVLVSGLHGEIGSVYALSTKSNYRITIKSGASGKYFELQQPDGVTVDFGATSNGLVKNDNGIPVLWSVSEERDLFQNSVSYTYSTEQGKQKIIRIDYDQYEVQFEYAEASTKKEGYPFPAYKAVSDSLISGIAILERATSDVFWAYSFDYILDQFGEKQLKKVSKVKGNSVISSGEFGYSPASTQTFVGTGSTLGQYGYNQGWSSSYPRMLEDVNGDGLTDIVGIANSGVIVALSRANGTFESPSHVLSQFGSNQQWNPSYHPRMMADVNGDGLADIVGFAHAGVVVALSKGDGTFSNRGVVLGAYGYNQGWNTSQHPRMMADVDGDGLADVVGFAHAGVAVALSKGDGTFSNRGVVLGQFGVNQGWSTDHPRMMADVNGDGMTDIVGIANSGVIVALAKGNGAFESAKHVLGQFGFNQHWSSSYHPRMMGDVNGDGLADIVGFAHGGVVVALSKGDGTFSYRGVVLGQYGYNQGWNTSYHPRMLADVNGDGMADVVGFAHAGVVVALSKGDGTFKPANTVLNQYGYSQQWRVGQHPRMVTDMDGDGLADIVGFASGGVKVSLSQFEKTLLTSMSPKVGHTININYDEAVTGTSYTETPGFVSKPNRIHVKPRLTLVSDVSKVDNLGNVSKTSYQYSDYQIIRGGIGSLGFHRIENTDETTGLKTITHYSQDWENRTTGMVTSTQTIAPDGVTVLSESVNQLENRFEGMYTDRYLPYIKATTTVQRDLDGSTINTTTLENQLTDEGWAEYEQTCVTSADLMAGAAGDMSQNTVTPCASMPNQEIYKETTYDYYPETYKPDFAPLLQRKTTTVSVPDAPPFQPATETRVVEYDYNNNGQVMWEKLEPNTALELKKSYTYHSSGQILTTTVSGPDFASRTTRIEYDPVTLLPLKQFNALNYAQTFEYGDSRFPWLATKVTAPDGSWVKSYFNSWGEKERTESGHGVTMATWSTTDKQWCEGNAQCEPDELFYTITDSATGQPSYVYFDQLGREVRKEWWGLNAGAPARIFQRTGYDERGQIDWAGQPYFADLNATEYGSVTTYDDLGRPIALTDADQQTSYIEYSGREVVYTDPNGHKKTVIKNALGQQVEVRDNRNNSLVYSYDAFGNMVYMRDPNNNETKIGFNIRGFKTRLDDPDQGVWEYDYNALGEMTDQTDALGQVTHTEFDLLGRMTSRADRYGTNQAETSNWTYFDASGPAAAIGKLKLVTNNNGYAQSYAYDAFGRLYQTTTLIDGTTYTTNQNYDDYWRPLDTEYPTGYTVRNRYHSMLGSLDSIVRADADTNPDNDYVFWQAESYNARGQLEHATLGSQISMTRWYNPATGMVEDMDATFMLTGTKYQDVSYDWDAVGNLTSFVDDRQGVSETYQYDDLGRLLTVNASTGLSTTSYDELGNITSKSGVGSYSYNEIAVPSECTTQNHSAGPHAVRRVTGAKANYFCYDQNGNLVKDKDRNLQYTGFNKPHTITRGASEVKFAYGPSRARYKRQDLKNGSATSTTYYLGNYEKVIDSGGTTHKITIGGVTQVIQKGSTINVNYLLKDHLGSITAIVNQFGTVQEEMSFDAWGNRRLTNLMLLSDPFSYKNSITDRGFTGHEHMDSVGLIHMNGRVYDPVISRFLSADPIIQAPGNLQSLNRYSYVMNNPLSMTDPSGYSWVSKKWKSLKNRAQRFVSAMIGAQIVTGWTGAMYGYQYRKARDMGMSVHDARKFGAKITAIDAASTALSLGAGNWLGNVEWLKRFGDAYFANVIAEGVSRVLVHGSIGGTIAKVSGGKFADGFVVSSVRVAYSFGMNTYFGGNNHGLFKLSENPILAVIEQTAVSAAAARAAGMDPSSAAASSAIQTALMAFIFNESNPNHGKNSKFRVGESVKSAFDEVASTETGAKIISALETDSRVSSVIISTTSGESLGITAVYSHPNRTWWKFWEGDVTKYTISIRINMSVSDPTFVALDGRLFTPSLSRVLSHELGHAYNYQQTGRTFLNHSSIQYENQIMQQLNADAIVRHPSMGHGR